MGVFHSYVSLPEGKPLLVKVEIVDHLVDHKNMWKTSYCGLHNAINYPQVLNMKGGSEINRATINCILHERPADRLPVQKNRQIITSQRYCVFMIENEVSEWARQNWKCHPFCGFVLQNDANMFSSFGFGVWSEVLQKALPVLAKTGHPTVRDSLLQYGPKTSKSPQWDF